MPLYEYECEACGVRFEQIQKFSDPHVEVCPSCGGVVHKLMSLPSFQFKGSGWYVTDYARKGQTAETDQKAGESKAGESKASESKTSGSTEREKSSPSGNTSSSSPSTPSTGSSSSDS